jgi:hypothetical protein
MAYAPTDPQSTPGRPTPQVDCPDPNEVRPSQYSDADHPRLVEDELTGIHARPRTPDAPHPKRWGVYLSDNQEIVQCRGSAQSSSRRVTCAVMYLLHPWSGAVGEGDGDSTVGSTAGLSRRHVRQRSPNDDYLSGTHTS